MADDIDARLDDWEARLDRLEEERRLEEEPALEEEPVPPASEPQAGHLIFVPAPSGYALVERTGPAPAPGDELDEKDGRYAVSRVVRSPLPGDDRLCAYVAPI